MYLTRDNKKLEVNDGETVLLVAELLPILFRYPAKIQRMVLQQLEPYEVTIVAEEENESKK